MTVIPPKPPPGQQGHRSYVWIPDILDAEDRDTITAEQLNTDNLVDDMVRADNDESEQTEKDYVDPYAAEIEDIPEGNDVNEAGIGKEDEDVMYVVCL